MEKFRYLLLAYGFFCCIPLAAGETDKIESLTLLDFLHDVQHLHGFDYLLWMHNKNATLNEVFLSTAKVNNKTEVEQLLLQEFMESLMVPIIQLDERISYYLNRKFSNKILTIVYMDVTLEQHAGLLKVFVANLRHITSTRVLFLLNQNEMQGEELMRNVFTFCWRNKLPNVALLFADFQHTANFYRYTHFPEFMVERVPITADVVQRQLIYPNRFRNMHRYKLPVIMGGSEPRIIASYGANGEIRYEGAVGHFLKTFEKKFNCELVQPLPAIPKHFAPGQDLIAAVRNGTVEISAGVTFPELQPNGYSYPFEQLNWCLMLPMEADVPAFEFYTLVFELHTFLVTLGLIVIISLLLSSALYFYGYHVHFVDFFLHDNCLRGALGQSFCEVVRAPYAVRGIYLQICVLGILLTTWYNSYFSAYVTSAPKRAPLNSYDDILASTLKIVAWKAEYTELIGRLKDFRKYEPMFYIEPDFPKYLVLRDSFNTKYGYMMHTAKWVIINEQQKVFTKRLFRMRSDLCPYNNIPICFPINENSIFRETIHQLILDVAAVGLQRHWLDMAVFEMIEAGTLSLADLSPKKEFRPMHVEDLEYVWIGFSFMVIFASSVFLCEILYFYRKYILRKIRAVGRILCCRRIKIEAESKTLQRKLHL